MINNINIGGKVIASGGFGCVFNPALRCETDTNRAKNKISKLMTEKHAIKEYNEIITIKKKLENIKNYHDYFLIYDTSLCKPAFLSDQDLKDYDSKCKALSKIKITKSNINNNLDALLSLNIPNGGLPVDDYMYNNGSVEKMYQVHISLMKLLKKGILPMNKRNVYHCDIKDQNVVIDENITSKLIDWGMTIDYVPFKNEPFPTTFKNRPLQFNVPFSVILFSNTFIEKYTKFLKNGGKPTKIELKPFVIDYISSWMKERGYGHYKFINEIMFELFSHSMNTVPKDKKPKMIETQITMNFIINYIIDVLTHFTKFGDNVVLNLRDYLDNVFLKIVDIWGFISIYFVFIEILFNNYHKLTPKYIEVFNKLKYIFIEYLYNPRHEVININELYSDLQDLEKLLFIRSLQNNKKYKIKNKTLKDLGKSKGKGNGKSKGLKTIKNKTIIFKRLPKKQRFKNPFYKL
jgi:serine/threonine protein kinase